LYDSGVDFCSALGFPVQEKNTDQNFNPSVNEKFCFSGEINVVPVASASSLFTSTIHTYLSSIIENWQLVFALVCAISVGFATYFFLPKILPSSNRRKDLRRKDNDRRVSALEDKAKGFKNQ
jgi:hypothetical protein